MKVVLVHPNNYEVYKNIKKSVHVLGKDRGKSVPIGLLYIAAALRKNGIDTKIIDAEVDGLDVACTARRVLDEQPDAVGFTVTTPLFSTCLEVANAISKERRLPFIYGGPHISALPLESLNHYFVDLVVVGEGEYAMVDIVRRLEKNASDVKYRKGGYGYFGDIPGVGYSMGGCNLLAPPRALIDNLDALPFPARDLIDQNKYYNLLTGQKSTLFVSSRGCPYHCTFCGSSVTFGHRIRYRSPVNVLKEMMEVRDMGIKDVIVADDTFALNKKWMIDVCALMTGAKLDLSLMCSSRVDTIDKEKLQWLKLAGFDIITFGIESGDDDVLKLMRKGITVQQSRKAVKLAKEVGIKVSANYMIGNIGDTEKTVQKTIDLAKELDTEFAQFTTVIPLPGTELWEMAKERRLIESHDYSKYCFYGSPTMHTNELSSERLLELQQYAYDSYRGGKQ